MSVSTETLEQFRETVSGPPDDVPLGRAALLIARAEYPDLDVDAYERRLEETAGALSLRLTEERDPDGRVQAASDLLFTELGFRGDEEQYDDPRNLFLNDVLDRRSGIPVTLTIVYVEVCQRAGLRVSGVGLPGHVVARVDGISERPYVDVFRGGQLLTARDCRRLVRAAYGRRMEFREHFLSAVTPRQLVQRLLRNLKARALQRGDEERAARAIELSLAMYPWDLDEVRDRGMLRERLGDYQAALADLEQYVRFRADARDIQTVNDAVRSLRRHIGADSA